MPSIPKKDMPRFVRQCHEDAVKSNKRNREAYNLRLRAYAGDQWTEEEKAIRKAQGRPFLVENRCKPAVDQIEGDIRQNPPGPKVLPVVGGHSEDAADPDIIEGLLREVEYRSHAETAYATAGKYSAAGGEACIELNTEYVNERSFDQRLRIDSCEDPSVWFWDPQARRANREDARWAGKLRMVSADEYRMQFGERRVIKPGIYDRATGWIMDALGTKDQAQVSEWTGAGKGPFYVCEFYMVEFEEDTLRLCTDSIARFSDDPMPQGVTARPGDENTRKVARRKVVKYIVDALECLDDEPWIGRAIPCFPVLGPEVWIDGVLHRLSLISGAVDSNRGLNYIVTTLVEFAGNMSKSPWVGPKGSFDDPRWATANRELHAYLEYTPVYVTNEVTGQQELAPPPTKNVFELAIQWGIALAAYFRDAIKGVTSIYDPSLGQQKNDQSGRAIEQLRSESSVGNFSYADNLHRAIELMYDEMCYIFPKLMDGPTVAMIVKPDTNHEMVRINQIFPDGVDPTTGKKGKANHIGLCEYSARVLVGPAEPNNSAEAVGQIGEALKAAPELMQQPKFAAQFIRLVGQGNPAVEALADIIDPPTDGDMSPQQSQQAIAGLQQKVQALTRVLQKAQQAIVAKLPELEQKRYSDELKAATAIAVAHVNASKDTDVADADRVADLIGQALGMAHERGMQHVEHAQQTAQAESAQAAAAAQSDQDESQS